MQRPTTVVPVLPRALPAILGAGLTHRGVVREKNEDAILTDPTGTLWAVADGMGGYGRGDVASDMVIDELSTVQDDADPFEVLEDRLLRANARIRGDAGSRPMGATVVALMVSRAVAHVVWAGDSRAYLLRGGRLRLLTRDHTVVQDLVDRGEIAADVAATHPEKHIITRAVGGDDDLEIETCAVPLVVGDRLLLCSDGLTACLGDGDILQTLAAARTPEAACRALVSDTLMAGAPDNVSVIVLFVVEGEG